MYSISRHNTQVSPMTLCYDGDRSQQKQLFDNLTFRLVRVIYLFYQPPQHTGVPMTFCFAMVTVVTAQHPFPAAQLSLPS